MKLNNLIIIKGGTNITRMNETDDSTNEVYTFENLLEDLNGQYLDDPENEVIFESKTNLSSAGDVIYSFMSSKAAIISKKNEGKIINQNFGKILITDSKLDKYYLCYLLNESPLIKKQLMIGMQGSSLRKVTPSTFRELEINLPILKKQKIIGESYFKFLKRQAFIRKELELEEKYFLQMLNQIDK